MPGGTGTPGKMSSALLTQIRCNELFLISTYFRLCSQDCKSFRIYIYYISLSYHILPFIASNLFRCIDTGIKPCTRIFFAQCRKSFPAVVSTVMPSLIHSAWFAAVLPEFDYAAWKRQLTVRFRHLWCPSITASIETQMVDTYSANHNMGCH